MGNLARRLGAKGALPWIVGALAGCQGPAEPPDPPAGGQRYVLDYAAFETSVEPVFAAYGCNTTQCHGGGIRGTFALSPAGAEDPAYDFEQARLQVDPYDPPASALLVQPLEESAGGLPHPWKPFDSVQHPGYRAIEDWILAGSFE
jgi:hypothetical protein